MTRRAFPMLLALAFLTACHDLPVSPQVEAAGEPGTAVYVASGPFFGLNGYPTTGRATYVLDANGTAALSLSSDFSAPASLRMAIFLSNTPDLSNAIKVGELTNPVGAQRWTFRVPV
ncbi:MAG: hypothetical protein EXR95_11235, partial [Gemmatimonadetes bacterium]|nr:hypothetical protein [Gemmatimonadota bacterium]